MTIKKRKRINNTVDLILLLLFLTIGLFFAIEAFIGQLIPVKYILIYLVLLIALFVLIFLTFKVRNQAIRTLRKVFLGLMCVGLLFGIVFQGKLRNAFLNVLDGSYSIDRMYVVTLKNNADKLESMDTIGHLSQSSSLLTYSLEQLNDYSFKKIEYNSVEEALSALEDKKIQAVLISAKDHSLLDENEFSSKYKLLHTIEMRVENQFTGSDIDITSKPFVVYIAGLDDMGKPTVMGHHDVNMLLMVDPDRQHVQMISINRDTYVPNSELGNYPDKLTHFGWYGPQMASDTLEKVFGIEIDYYAKVTFESLIKIIDTLGGIDVDVKLSFTEQDENRSFDAENLITLEKGYQHLNGKQALAYARHRYTDGWDVKGREEAQRDIIAATVNKLLSVEGVLKVGDVLNVAASYVATNMPMDKAKSFVMSAIDKGGMWSFSSAAVNSDTELILPCAMGGGVERSSVLLENSDIQMVHDIYVSMNSEINLSEFAFDMDSLEDYMESFRLDKHVITVENYYDVVPKYFPDYLRYRL